MRETIKTISYVIFFTALILSIHFVVFCYQYADAVRGYDGTGGEIFSMILPIGIVAFRLWVEECNKELAKKYKRKGDK